MGERIVRSGERAHVESEKEAGWVTLGRRQLLWQVDISLDSSLCSHSLAALASPCLCLIFSSPSLHDAVHLPRFRLARPLPLRKWSSLAARYRSLGNKPLSRNGIQFPWRARAQPAVANAVQCTTLSATSPMRHLYLKHTHMVHESTVFRVCPITKMAAPDSGNAGRKPMREVLRLCEANR